MTRFTFSSFRAVLLLPALTLALFGQNGGSIPDGPTHNVSTRLGATDPAGSPSNFTLFRDQQLFLMGLGTQGNPWPTATATFDANLTPTATVSKLPWSSSLPYTPVDIQAVAGRIVHPDKDDIAIVQRWEADPTKLAVRFKDGTGLTTMGSLPPRVAGWTDFFSSSEGDLDRLYDSKGNYHDEVVAAWMELEPIADCNTVDLGATAAVPHIAVLNYNNGTATPSVLEQRLNRDDQQYTTACGLEGYNAFLGQDMPTVPPQPVDNILATAIGDFDGDGYNELAVAYMRGTAGMIISIVIYRYQNDGGNPSLTPVNTFEIYRPDRSMVGTLSLAAGDFDGSGMDQLLVGSAYWWGAPGAPDYLGRSTYKSGTFQTQPVLFLIKGGQVWNAITAAASAGTDNSQTQFAVSLRSGAYVPRTVTISGATGSWAAINGTWPVSPTANGFSLALDSSKFGSFDGQTVQFTAAAPLTQTDTNELDAFPGLAGFSPGPIHIDDADKDDRIRVQLVPGLFHYDPTHGLDYRRRQVAMAWNAKPAYSVNRSAAEDGDPHLAIVQITDDDKITIAAEENGLLGAFQGNQTLQLAAGAFLGDNNTNDPTWSIFIGAVQAASQAQPFSVGQVHSIMKVAPDSTDPSKLQVSRICSGKAMDPSYGDGISGLGSPYCNIWGDNATIDLVNDSHYLRLPAIAADLNGNSVRLGAPAHFEIFTPAKADFILEQPPQHAAWLDEGSGAEVVTISRYPSFNTSMQDSQKKAFASNSQSHTDWTVGASEQITAAATQSIGTAVDGLDLTNKAKVQISAKVAYDYDHVSTDYNSHSDSYQVGRGTTTGTDDSLILEGQIFDVWRYRVYGQGTDTGDPNNPNAFYDIVIPGPSIKQTLGGLNNDWYQPVHEVGNILSYPGYDAVCRPSDIGPITIPNTDISNKAVPLISCSGQFYNGNSSTVSLQLDHTTGSGNSTDYTNKLHGDLDVNVSYTNTTMFEGTGLKVSGSSDTDIHGGSDWGHLNTSENSTTDSTGITINSPQGNSENSYPYYPIFYDTTSGALKVAYAVGGLDQQSTGTNFWVDNYGGAPDPALNLPYRFDATYSENNFFNGWMPDNTILRKRMKGFAVRKSALDPKFGGYDLLGSNPQDGDTVLLDARVYNYSLSATPATFTVQFSIIPYDGPGDNEICPGMPSNLKKGGHVCPVKYRTPIGQGSAQPGGGSLVFSLNARENAQAYLMWNTKGSGPKSAGANAYRVYVDLVPNNNNVLNPLERPCTSLPCEVSFNSPNEKDVDGGQNKEGWGLISVAAPKPNLLGASETNAIATPTSGSLSADSPSALQTLNSTSATAAAAPSAVAYLHEPLHMRITAFSNAVSTIYGYVTIYDGKPGARGTTTIAGKILLGLQPDGSSAWFDWTPRTIGPHHLYAVTFTAKGEQALGYLIVQVRRAPGDLTGAGRVDRHDLNILHRDLRKSVAESACGEQCDLDGDGMITQKDANLMMQLCDSPNCAFEKIEYVGGASPLEPDMRTVRAADEAATAAFKATNPDDAKLLDRAAPITTAQLYHSELNRKQALRSVQYYYRGKPVTRGPYAAWQTAMGKTDTSGNQ